MYQFRRKLLLTSFFSLLIIQFNLVFFLNKLSTGREGKKSSVPVKTLDKKISLNLKIVCSRGETGVGPSSRTQLHHVIYSVTEQTSGNTRL